MQVYTYDVYLKLQTMSTELSEMILKRKRVIIVNLQINSVSQRLVQCKRMQVYFNAFFASQCTPNSNDSALPDVTNHISNVSLSSIQFEDQDILNIICSLNYNKAHGYDDISIRF